jgi:hypothetical protein
MAASGTLATEEGVHSLQIDKALLARQYKKGSLSRRKGYLERHGFSVQFLNDQGETSSLSRASQVCLCHDIRRLVPALKLFAERIEALGDAQSPVLRGPKAVYNKLGMFMKGDYGAAFLGQPVLRDALDPLAADILRPLGTHAAAWADLVHLFRDECQLECSGFWTYGGTPAWGVSFAARGTRPLAIFTLGPEIVFIEFTLPLDAAERIIRERGRYSPAIRERIEAFHCVQCPKECRGSNMARVDGVSLCTGRAEARRIYATLSSPEDFESIRIMTKLTL